jgi:hypothetical protein
MRTSERFVFEVGPAGARAAWSQTSPTPSPSCRPARGRDLRTVVARAAEAVAVRVARHVGRHATPSPRTSGDVAPLRRAADGARRLERVSRTRRRRARARFAIAAGARRRAADGRRRREPVGRQVLEMPEHISAASHALPPSGTRRPPATAGSLDTTASASSLRPRRPAAAERQTVPDGDASPGSWPAPVHVSAASHAPPTRRPSTPPRIRWDTPPRAGCTLGHVAHAPERHTVPEATKPSADSSPTPMHVSATSHAPAADRRDRARRREFVRRAELRCARARLGGVARRSRRGTVLPGERPSAGQAVDAPVQCSAAAGATPPADGRRRLKPSPDTGRRARAASAASQMPFADRQTVAPARRRRRTGAAPRAPLGEVAHARRRATEGGRRDEHVRRAARGRARADLREVTHARGRPAHAPEAAIASAGQITDAPVQSRRRRITRRRGQTPCSA